MKKLSKALSLIIAFAMVLPTVPIAANTTPNEVVYDFETANQWSGFNRHYGSSTMEDYTDSVRGKVLKIGSTNNVSAVEVGTGFPTAGGIITYEFDIKAETDTNVIFCLTGYEDPRRVAALQGDGINQLNPVNAHWGAGTAYGWNKIKLEINLDTDMVAVYGNGVKLGEQAETNDMKGKESTLTFRSSRDEANPPVVYLDNFTATYKAPIPKFAVTAAQPSIDGITTLADFRTAESIKIKMPITNTYPEAESVDATFIVALYKDSALVGCTSTTASGQAAGRTTSDIEETLSDVSFKAGIDYDSVKIYAWNSLTGISPLCENGVIEN